MQQEKDIVYGDVPMRVCYTEENDAVYVSSIHLLQDNKPCGVDIAPMLNATLLVVPGYPPVPTLSVIYGEIQKCLTVN